jgi:DNA-binding MarR family transcriptional regulator
MLVGTRDALEGDMDPVFFGLKRAFHSTLRISRRDFEEIKTTPARMDILYALSKVRRGEPPIWQSSLRRIIGYTARSTMTQIMQALERLGLVVRRRSEQDERQLEVELTPAGRALFKEASRRFLQGWSLDAPSLARVWPPPNVDEREAWQAYLDELFPLRKILFNLRIALRDTGRLRYRWVYH